MNTCEHYIKSGTCGICHKHIDFATCSCDGHKSKCDYFSDIQEDALIIETKLTTEEMLEKIKKIRGIVIPDITNSMQLGYRTLEKYERLNAKLFRVSGYTVEELIELFAAGYRLIPPECKTMEEKHDN